MPIFTFVLATLGTTAEINLQRFGASEPGEPFSLTGTVSAALFNAHYIIEDDTGRAHVRSKSSTAARAGDRVTCTGFTSVDAYGENQAIATNVSVLGHGEPPPPRTEGVARIARGEANFANVMIEGSVVGCFPDDIDFNWNYLILRSGGSFIYVSVPRAKGESQRIEDFARTTVSVRGTVIHGHCGARRVIGPHVETSGFHDLRILRKPPVNGIPTASALNDLTPSEVIGLGPQTLEGRVVAGWGDAHLLIRDDFNGIHRVDLMSGLPLPAVGSRVRAVGMPETDLYRINLSKARCETLARPANADIRERAVEVNLQPGLRHVHFHGRTVRVSGRIGAEPTARSDWRAILVTDGGERYTVDISTLPETAEAFAVGNIVDLTGCGLIETDNWQPGASFPLQKDLVVVIRSPSDIQVVSRPPWWTTGRLLAVIGALAGLLVGVAIWNRILNRLVERRGRELYREALAHAASELRIAERTRLAAEMHDSLSQSLTGISCQIDAMEGARVKRPERIPHHLGLARRLLDGCRMQLRNCLWDLRNDILNEPDAAQAVRQTILPHAGTAELTVEFPISRARFSDTTFHEILCILRELVANAIRHGQATVISITARDERDRIIVTVTDNGCGFDPDHCLGHDEGHFGLLGVRERLFRLKSALTISSTLGQGTACSFTLDTKHE